MGKTAGSLPVKTATYRQDIQGLRAILMVQVMLFHAWMIGSPIGVDAFIMISAYLMTGSFVRRAEAGQTPRVLERWAHTFKRLLPPLAVVVVLTLLASVAVLPTNRWNSMVDQSYASLTYWQNWLLQWVATDYFADNHALSSPLQHLWSMSMQGQVFLLWPVVMGLLVVLARRWKLPIRQVVFWGFAALAAVSLLWLVTNDAPPQDLYFDTRGRIWEFALGSAIAAAPNLRFQRPTERLFANVSFVVLVIFSLVSIGVYPGPMAAVPLLATSALLLYSRDDPAGVGRVLSARPLVALGNISYAVYLVHWPIFVLYLAATSQDQLSVVEGIVLIAVSVFLAQLLTKYVDDPARRSPWARTTPRKAFVAFFALWLGFTFTMTVQNGISQTAVAAERRATEAAEHAQTGQTQAGHTKADAASAGEEFYASMFNPEFFVAEPREEAPVLPTLEGFPGAAAMGYEGDFKFSPEPIPTPFELDSQWVLYEGNCSSLARSYLSRFEKTGCHQHGTEEESSGRVLVAGSSHAEQVVMPAAAAFADRNDLFVEASLQTGCPWELAGPEGGKCDPHNVSVLQYAKDHPVDYVFMIVTSTATDSGKERLGAGMEQLVEELTATGAQVFGIRDNLRSRQNLYECSPGQGPSEPYGGCLLKRKDFFGSNSIVDPLLDIEGFHYIDVMDLYCDGKVCPTIAGNVQIYLDTNHVTRAYAETMAPIIAERAENALANG